jgi:hypothetical protein
MLPPCWLVLEVEDNRSTPPPLEVTVKTDRPAERVVGKHVTRCAAGGDDTGVHVTQVFQEKAYHCAAAVAARISDDAAKVQPAAEGVLARTLAAPGRTGKRLVSVASAASWDPKVDVLVQARRRLADAAAASLPTVLLPAAVAVSLAAPHLPDPAVFVSHYIILFISLLISAPL